MAIGIGLRDRKAKNSVGMISHFIESPGAVPVPETLTGARAAARTGGREAVAGRGIGVAADAGSGAPHFLQNFPPGAATVPQRAHATTLVPGLAGLIVAAETDPWARCLRFAMRREVPIQM